MTASVQSRSRRRRCYALRRDSQNARKMPQPDQGPEASGATVRSLEQLCCARDAERRTSAACLHCATTRTFADEDWDGLVGPVVVVQRAVTSGVIAPVTRGRTSSLFSITTVHSAPDLSRQFVSNRLRAPSISLGLATQ